MSVLAHVLERAGLATVGISIVRRQAENARPPRILHCEFPLGRPLGRPNDPTFQRDVLTRAFDLLERTDVPVLEDHPGVIEDQADTAASCSLPPLLDAGAPPAVAEARGLRSAYDRNVAASQGRTAVGRIVDADGVPDLIARFLRVADDGATLADVDLAGQSLIAAGQDLRAYYEEAGLQLADVTGARQLESWFYDVTESGRLVRRVQKMLLDAGTEKFAAEYLLPLTRSR